MSTTRSNWSAPSRPLGSVNDRLDAQEVRRRIWHMAPGFLPFILWGIPHRDPLSPLLLGIIIGIFLVLTIGLFWVWSRVARTGVGKSDRIAAIYGYAGPVLLTLLLFPAHPECGLAVLGVLAFGDGSATLFGRLFGESRLPWNPEKSYAGLVGFVAVGLPMTALIYWGESHNLMAAGPPATVLQTLIIATAGVTAGAFAESVVSRVNDNLRVGFGAATAILLTHALFFGL